MRLAANALSCARTSETFVDDERHGRGGEVIHVEADAAVMEAALASADRVELAREFFTTVTHACVSTFWLSERGGGGR